MTMTQVSSNGPENSELYRDFRGRYPKKATLPACTEIYRRVGGVSSGQGPRDLSGSGLLKLANRLQFPTIRDIAVAD
jgi:hypothetical protein